VHKRDLPWRTKEGETPDPYPIWLSEVMLQQTTVATVTPYFLRFIALFPHVHALANAPSESVMQAWAGLGYYSRARNLHRCAQQIVNDYHGVFPHTAHALQKLSGIGAYTSAAIAAIAFGEPIAAVDGNVERVVSRVHAIAEPLPASRSTMRAHAQQWVPKTRAGDFAQALMELGARICRPKNPHCKECPVQSFCLAFAQKCPTNFPVKTPKKPPALRYGLAYVVKCGDTVLIRTRPANGLLGGMAEVPTSDWQKPDALHPLSPSSYHDASLPEAPMKAVWKHEEGQIVHIFSHIRLTLEVFSAIVPADTPAPDGWRWVVQSALKDEPLSTLMRKVLAQGGAL
jgi:A/G-specific adenine glycosylase